MRPALPLALAVVILLLSGLTAALALPPRPTTAEASYIVCAGVADPVDSGVCLPAPYPDRLPLDDLPV